MPMNLRIVGQKIKLDLTSKPFGRALKGAGASWRGKGT